MACIAASGSVRMPTKRARTAVSPWVKPALTKSAASEAPAAAKTGEACEESEDLHGIGCLFLLPYISRHGPL